MINIKNFFKLLNYFFSLVIILYVVFLISRIIFERSPRELIFFCGVYVSFVGLALVIPQILNWFVIRQKRQKIKKTFNQDNQDKESSLRKIKSSIILWSFSLGIKTRNFFQQVSKNFFFEFLAKNLHIKIFFFLLIKKIDLILKNERRFIIIFLIIPWLIFILVFIFESLTKQMLYWSLYLISINFFIKFLIKNIILLNIKYILIPSNILFQIYLTKINSNEQSKSFFLSHPVMKEMFFTNFDSLLNKKVLIFLWNLFGGIYYPYLLKLKIENFQFIFNKTSKFLRIFNLIIFSITLIFTMFQTESLFFYVVMLFSGWVLIFIIFLNSLKAENNVQFNVNNTLLHDFNNWFIKAKKVLLKKHKFLRFDDLPWFYNKKSAKKMVSESLEIKNIIDKAVIGENLSFAEFSDYLLTEKETEDLRIAEDIIYDWYIARVAEGVIGETNEFDYEKYTLSLKKNNS